MIVRAIIILSAAAFVASVFMTWGEMKSGPLTVEYGNPGMSICVTPIKNGISTCKELDWQHANYAHSVADGIYVQLVSTTGDAYQRVNASNVLRNQVKKWKVPSSFPRLGYVFSVAGLASFSGVFGNKYVAILPAMFMATAMTFMVVYIPPAVTSFGYGFIVASVATALNLFGTTLLVFLK